MRLALARIEWPARPGRLRRAHSRVRSEPGRDRGDTVVDHVRLFPLRRMSGGRTGFTSRFCRPCGRPKVPVRWTELTVRHTGYVDPALRARKLERDIRMLAPELQDRPNDPFVLFNLGAIAVERQRVARRRSVISSAAWPARRRPTRSCASCLP